MLGYMEVDERRTNFIVIEVRRAGERAIVSMGEAFEEMFDLLDSGRDERGRTDISRATAEAVGGTIFFRMNAAFEQGSMEAVRAKMPGNDVHGGPPLPRAGGRRGRAPRRSPGSVIPERPMTRKRAKCR